MSKITIDEETLHAIITKGVCKTALLERKVKSVAGVIEELMTAIREEGEVAEVRDCKNCNNYASSDWCDECMHTYPDIWTAKEGAI